MIPTWRRLLFLAVLVGALASGTAALAAPPRPTGSNRTQAGRATGDPLAVPPGRWVAPAPNPPAPRPAPAPPPASPRPTGTATAVAVLAAAAVAAATGKRSVAAVAPATAPRPSTPVAVKPSPAVARALQAEARDPQRGAVVTPLLPPGSKPATEALNSLILEAKQEYDRARAQADTGTMEAAHRRAEWLRTQGGTAGSDQSTAAVQEQRQVGLNAGIVQAKTDYAAAAARGDQAAMSAAHARAEGLRRQGGGIAAAETLDEAKLHLQAGVDRQVTAEKERFAAGTAAQQDLAHRRAEELRRAAGAQGVAVIGAGTSLAEARERAAAEGNRQVLLDKVAHERAHSSGDAASQALLHRDAQAQRQAGASIGAHETVVEAREHLQRHLDEGIVAQKDAFAGHASPSRQEQAHRRAEALRQVGQSLGLGTIGQEVSLADAQVHLVLGGGPLVAGGKRTPVQAADVERLRHVQAGVTAGAPNADEMRSAYRELLARSRTGDVSAIAALAVLQRQADKANVQLNPPPPPRPAPVQRPSAVGSGGLSGEDVRLRTHEAVTAETNRFVALNAGEDARLRAYDGVATPCLMSIEQQIEQDHRVLFDELEKWHEQNRRLAALYIVPEGALLKGAALAAEGVKAAAVAAGKTEVATTLGARMKGFASRVLRLVLSRGKAAEEVGATAHGAALALEDASVIESFEGGRYSLRITTEPETVYRAEGGSSKTFGRFFGTVKPETGAHAEQLSNLASWGNELTEVSTYVIPPGTTIYEGRVADGTGWQYFIADPRAAGLQLMQTEPLPAPGF